MDNKILRVLIIDNSPDDAEFVTEALRQGQYHLKTQRVDTHSQLDAALSSGAWDVIFADSAVIDLKLAAITTALRTHKSDAPLFVAAPTLDSQTAQHAMSHGACDVFLKGDWSRLLPALARELRVHQDRRAYRELKETSQQLEQRYRAMIESSQEAVCYCHDGMYVDANPAYLALFGYANPEELKGVPLLDAINQGDRSRLKSLLQQSSTLDNPVELLAVKKDGTVFPVEIALSPINIADEACTQITLADISRRKALEQKLELLRRRDPLTGLCNKRSFMAELGVCLAQAQTEATACSLLTLELCQLREINDSFGHAACDRLLLTLARQLQKLSGERDLLARTGGGQFAVLLRGLTPEESARAESGYQLLARKFTFTDNGKRFDFKFAISLVALDASVSDANTLLTDTFKTALRSIDSARAPAPAVSPAPHRPDNTPTLEFITEVKSDLATTPAANQVAAETEPDAKTEPPAEPRPDNIDEPSELPWKKELEHALEHNKLALYFQPIINLVAEPHEYYETVLYLESPSGDFIPASEFMPTALACGFAGKIDRWVASRAVDVLAKQAKRATLFITLSSSAFGDSVLLAALQQQMRTHGVKPDRLIVQIDASLIVCQEKPSAAFAQVLKKIGIGIAIDNLDPETVGHQGVWDIGSRIAKINCTDLPQLQQTVASVRAKHVTAIVKNVVEAEIFSALWTQKVDYVQGDYLSPPTPEPDYNFEGDEELSSESAAPNWRING